MSPRRIRVNWVGLVDAFDSGFDMMKMYLDLETGEVILITDETWRDLENLQETLPAEVTGEAYRAAITEAFQEHGAANSELEMLLEASEVEDGLGSRFIEVPEAGSREGYRDMEAFIETVESPHFQELLEVAINGRGAFGRFKDVLVRYPDERERWFAFKDARMRERVCEWLADEGIEPINEPG